MNNATLKSGDMGLALDYGSLIIDGKSTLEINSAVSAELELGSSFEVLIQPGAIVEATGPVKYVTTSFP
jgi:hypothetical protein